MIQFLENYDRDAELYRAFSERLRALVVDILDARDIPVHSVVCRVKARQSLERKLMKAEGKYAGLQAVTDLIGIRIITYFADHVDRAAQAIRDEFAIDVEHSIDKRDLLDPDRFGYLSLHYVVSLAANRATLVEFQRFAQLKAEVQIRSILQHAWAEIEHDLGYKTTAGVPRDIRRQFSRLAGLLEIADREFTAIRTQLHKYESDVSEQIRIAPSQVLIDKASVRSYIETSELLRDADAEIGANRDVSVDNPSDDFIELIVQRLAALDVRTIAAAEELLSQNRSQAIKFAQASLDQFGAKTRYRGLALLYAAFWLLFESGGDDAIRAYANSGDLAANVQEALFEYLSAAWRAARGGVGPA